MNSLAKAMAPALEAVLGGHVVTLTLVRTFEGSKGPRSEIHTATVDFPALLALLMADDDDETLEVQIPGPRLVEYTLRVQLQEGAGESLADAYRELHDGEPCEHRHTSPGYAGVYCSDCGTMVAGAVGEEPPAMDCGPGEGQ